MIYESKIDVSKKWYLGNNLGKNLRLRKPNWNQPLFLTTSIQYASDYADYGVYEVQLKPEIERSSICDFSNLSDTSKLGWPSILIQKINSGKSDLNSIACDLHILGSGEKLDLMQIERSRKWMEVAQFFYDDIYSEDELPFKQYSHWQDEPDYDVLLRMWMMIKRSGFDGFTHIEFEQPVLALFDLKEIDKIKVKRVL